ncbi:hypothetical protein MtrunA17_Chr8g0338371 [Medicago truncatula]|uniref:Uncharacterized protein n=1 Tax=Medicago truncatula TaxID=3880 RepID=A0A396GJI2_MEDTR|nr:hypothetical protein MtrunA17_Chr8g0338371 [Medicago truncatula]
MIFVSSLIVFNEADHECLVDGWGLYLESNILNDCGFGNCLQ